MLRSCYAAFEGDFTVDRLALSTTVHGSFGLSELLLVDRKATVLVCAR